MGANAIIEFMGDDSGLTGLTLNLYPKGVDTVAVSGLAMTEASSRKGVYTTVCTAGLTGSYQAFIFNSDDEEIANGYVLMSDDTSVHSITPNDTSAISTVLADMTLLQQQVGRGQIVVSSSGGSGGANYCQVSDIQNRLTVNGFRWTANKGNHGSPTTQDIENYITSAIRYAGNIADEAVHSFIAPGAARGAGNPWLIDRVVDIAVWYATSQGGRAPPEVFVTAYQDSLERLNAVKGGDRVPGLIYPPPPFSRGRSARFPRVVNPR